MYDMLHEIGGIERLMCTHAKFLLSAGYRVKLLFGSIDKNLLSNEIYKGLEIEEYGPKINEPTLKLLGSIIFKNKLKQIIQSDDVIIAYSFPINAAVRGFNNLKITYLNHYPNFLYLPIKERWTWANNLTRKIAFFYSLFLGPITKYYDKKYIKKCNFVFANSNFTKRRLDPLYEINGLVSYPPVNSIFKPLISNNTLDKFQIKGPYLFSSGRIIPDKRFDLLLEAYAKSKQQIPLIISGKGSELNNLNRLAEQLSIKDKVKFVGFVTTEELQNLYSSAQCYVMPTPEEDFGLTTAEAISCGSPLIVWDDDGGSCEQCIDGINGYKAKPYDTLNMANKIDQCISDKFKQSHEKEIKESSYKFSEEGQRSVFLIAIKEVLNKK
jgi:glycosyltransferase involved in cell wall biosynthesis